MITSKDFPNKDFESKQDLFKALVDNKDALIKLKKSTIKQADAFGFAMSTPKILKVDKSDTTATNPPATEIEVKVVINTTKLFDSHGDVHIDGLWKRSLQHSNKKLHLQEHKNSFDKVINNEAKAYTQIFNWKELGADYEGKTEALVFDSIVKASRNPVMFEQYANKWVTNHSVGMQYVEIKMCINSDENWASEYKNNYDEYIKFVANKEDVEEAGYFWAVTEAKVIEGSAVLMGSNWITPTLENKQNAEAPVLEPSKDTQNEKQLETIKLKF